jgi:hypothetical protein
MNFRELRKLLKEEKNLPMLTNQNEIKDWLDKMKIKNYIINSDLTVDVNENVTIEDKSITHFPIQFGVIEGNFRCTDTQLKTLKGSPKIVKGFFDVNSNQLTTLRFAPKVVDNFFNCGINQLISLKHISVIEVGNVMCHRNSLKSLKYAPQKIYGYFTCANNELTSLKYAPIKITLSFMFEENQISDLKYFPKEVGAEVRGYDNLITSLKGLPKKMEGPIILMNNLITSLKNSPQLVNKYINLMNNHINDLSGAPQNCQNLYLDNNKITSLENLRTLTQELSLSGNSIKLTFEELNKLKITYLTVNVNAISKENVKKIMGREQAQINKDNKPVSITLDKDDIIFLKELLKVEYEKALFENMLEIPKAIKKHKL